MSKRIGFVGIRFSGIDGVSLEAGKCAAVLERNGHECFWFAGMLDRAPDKSFLVPQAAIQYEKNQWIDQQVFGKKRRDSSVTDTIYELKIGLKKQLKEFVRHFRLDLIIAENVLTNPVHISLGLALTEMIAETQIPTVAHHHDFY